MSPLGRRDTWQGGGLRKNVYEGFKSPAGVQLDPQGRDVLRLVDKVVEPRWEREEAVGGDVKLCELVAIEWEGEKKKRRNHLGADHRVRKSCNTVEWGKT